MRFLRRLATVPLVLVAVTLATFALAHAVPGDAATANAGARGATPEALAAFRAEYGLDRPLPAQYLSWLSRSARLDFGVSLRDGRPVRDKIWRALPVTLALAGLAVLLAFALAVPLGIGLGMADRSRFTPLVSGALQLAYALPGAAVALAASPPARRMAARPARSSPAPPVSPCPSLRVWRATNAAPSSSSSTAATCSPRAPAAPDPRASPFTPRATRSSP